jgi:hypothetical protein
VTLYVVIRCAYNLSAQGRSDCVTGTTVELSLVQLTDHSYYITASFIASAFTITVNCKGAVNCPTVLQLM